MRKLAAILALLMSSACGQRAPAPPTTPNPGGGGGETITGRERIGWDQQADSADELASFGYAMFVDGNRAIVDAVTCGAAPAAAGFPCSGRLPPMSGGAHTLELATFQTRNGETLESARSAPLRVVVAAASAIEVAVTAPAGGETVSAVRETASRVNVVVTGLQQPNDLAIAPDGRAFIAEASGRISIVAGGRRRTALEPVPGTRVEMLALALDPQFARNGFVYGVRVALDAAPPMFEIVRYREVGGTLGEAATLLDSVAASQRALDSLSLARDRPAAALRFGPDGRLYAAFEERSDATTAQGAYNGTILRLNPDGTTPRDQRGGSPVFAPGARRPRGLSWDPGGVLWILDGDPVKPERLIAAAPTQGPSYTLPAPFGAAAAVFHSGGDLLIGAEAAGYILRVQFDQEDRTRVVGTERLLKGDVDAVRAIAVAMDGTVYACTSTALIDLKSLSRAGKSATPR